MKWIKIANPKSLINFRKQIMIVYDPTDHIKYGYGKDDCVYLAREDNKRPHLYDVTPGNSYRRLTPTYYMGWPNAPEEE